VNPSRGAPGNSKWIWYRGSKGLSNDKVGMVRSLSQVQVLEKRGEIRLCTYLPLCISLGSMLGIFESNSPLIW